MHFATSCAAGVQPAFDRAMALLHSFWFSQAREAFTGVAREGSRLRDRVLGHRADALRQPVWGQPAGRSHRRRPGVNREGARRPRRPRANASTSLAAAELFKNVETTDQRTRALAYEQAMSKLAKAHPDDTEATIFYALALAQTALPTDKSYKNLLAAGALLEPLFAAAARSPRRRALHHPRLRRPAARAEGARRRTALRGNRPLGAPRASHAVAHVHARRRLAGVDRLQPPIGRSRAPRARRKRRDARDGLSRVRVPADRARHGGAGRRDRAHRSARAAAEGRRAGLTAGDRAATSRRPPSRRATRSSEAPGRKRPLSPFGRATRPRFRR